MNSDSAPSGVGCHIDLGIWATPVATVAAAVIGGGFILAAAILAWRSVQADIGAQRESENAKQDAERHSLEQGLIAELLVFATAVIRATGQWNSRAWLNPDQPATNWPTLVHPHFYTAVVGQLGSLKEGWIIAALITLFGNVLELNDIAREAAAGRPIADETIRSTAERFRLMASNLADALNGLTHDRSYPTMGFDLRNLSDPHGRSLAEHSPPIETLQQLLFALSGNPDVHR